MTITVFLADDHTVVREGLRAYVDAKSDMRVIGEAGDGREAVEQICDLEPDVAVLDIGMPKVNGIDATEEICRRCPSVAVVILSMHSTNEYVFRALRAGARGFVIKEAAGRELIDAVRTVHTGHRYLSRKLSDQLIEDYVERRETIKEKTPLDELSEREQQILKHVVEGKTTAEIAESLSLSATTINTYRSRLMKKLKIGDLPSLVKFAIRHGLTEVE